MKFFLTFLLLFPPLLYAEAEPKPEGSTEPSVISTHAAKGTGTKTDPFIYNDSSIPVLAYTGDAQVKWDLEEGPPNVSWLTETMIGFPLSQEGSYRITLYGDGVYKKLWLTIKSGTDPPKDDPSPTPEEDDKTVETGKLSVIIVTDQEKLTKLSQGQLNVINSTEIRQYASSHCEVRPDGTVNFKVYEKRQDLSRAPPKLKDGFGKAVSAMGEEPAWMVITNGKAGTSIPIPDKIPDALKVLKKYGGE